MKIPLIERRTENHTRRLLRRLMRGLDREFSKNARRLRTLLKHTHRLCAQVRAAIDKPCLPDELRGRLSGWTTELLAALDATDATGVL